MCCARYSTLLLPLVVLVLVGVAQVEGAEPEGATRHGDEPSLASSIQSTLGLGNAKGDFLNELAGALSALSSGKAGAELERSIRALVERAGKGAQIDSFTPLLLRQITLTQGRPKVQDDWRYGRDTEREELRRYIWNKAVSMRQSDPEGAKTYARAALVLAAHEDMTFGTLDIRVFARDMPRLVKLAQLDPKQAKQIEDLVALLNREAKGAGGLLVRVFEAEEALIESKERPLPRDLVNKSMASLREHREFVSSMKGTRTAEQLSVVVAARNLRNLVKAYGDDESKAAVSAMLKEWQAQARPGSFERRLLDEAIAVEGPPMTRSRIARPGRAKSPQGAVQQMQNVGQALRKPLGLASLTAIGAILCFAKWRTGRGTRVKN
jgi:hypothetical protein